MSPIQQTHGNVNAGKPEGEALDWTWGFQVYIVGKYRTRIGSIMTLFGSQVDIRS